MPVWVHCWGKQNAFIFFSSWILPTGIILTKYSSLNTLQKRLKVPMSDQATVAWSDMGTTSVTTTNRIKRRSINPCKYQYLQHHLAKRWLPETVSFISKAQKTEKTEGGKKYVAFSAVLKRPLKDLYSGSWGGREVGSICSHMTHTRIKPQAFTCSSRCPRPV